MIGIDGVNRFQRVRDSESSATMPADPVSNSEQATHHEKGTFFF
jgi:hypothetical protein